jgi:hypothetical protein
MESFCCEEFLNQEPEIQENAGLFFKIVFGFE